MNEREALLHAVIEHPDEDTPRLVYADWLQENGEEPRAEFIRMQIEMARADQFSSHVCDLTARQHKLLRSHGPRWSAELPKFPQIRWGQHFERGFVETIDIYDLAQLPSIAEELFAATPIIEFGCMLATDIELLAGIPQLSCVRHLKLWLRHPRAESVWCFARATNLKSLETLTIWGATIDFELEDLLAERFGSKLIRSA